MQICNTLPGETPGTPCPKSGAMGDPAPLNRLNFELIPNLGCFPQNWENPKLESQKSPIPRAGLRLTREWDFYVKKLRFFVAVAL